ncbi:unnamed protein product [Meganyctiphanes norvegica]|uniref:Epoxide hydrolase n=1 Tax=Meganyctiphanes norvegica TaxID=48144 RepID=A0AAV2RNR7_MEGNR
MGLLRSILTLFLVVIVVLTGIFVGIQVGGAIYSSPPSLPQLDPNVYWGPGKYKEDDITIKPYQIAISKEDVKDLKMRLNLPLRLQPSVEGTAFTYGFNSGTLEKVIEYWRKEYDWEKRETHLNSYPHFKTEIEGLNIHFMRAKPIVESGKQIKVVPLLLIHGWPGSFVEFYDIIPKLIEPQEGSDVVFEVICPSIPGYGFSDAPAKKGVGTLEAGQIFLKLMNRLGFNQFYLQGGDWGSLIATDMATMYPDNILGVHLNMFQANTPGVNAKWFLGNFLPSGLFMDPKDEPKMYPMGKKLSFLAAESGYMHIQATKPDTIGAALDQSPVSLGVYILEKFSTWTHKDNTQKPDGGLLQEEFPIALDAMLDNICIYWFTGSITSSTRFYAENFNEKFFQGRELDIIPCNVPSGHAAFPEELMVQPKTFIAHKFYDIVTYTDMEVGGHFPAMERPLLLAADLHKFVSLVEKRKILDQSKEKLNEL